MNPTARIEPANDYYRCGWPARDADECGKVASFLVNHVPYCHYHAEEAYLALPRALRLEAIERAWRAKQEELEASYV